VRAPGAVELGDTRTIPTFRVPCGSPARTVELDQGSGIDLWCRGNGVPFPRHQLLTHIR
jgi:hypothetical protein